MQMEGSQKDSKSEQQQFCLNSSSLPSASSARASASVKGMECTGHVVHRSPKYERNG